MICWPRRWRFWLLSSFNMLRQLKVCIPFYLAHPVYSIRLLFKSRSHQMQTSKLTKICILQPEWHLKVVLSFPKSRMDYGYNPKIEISCSILVSHWSSKLVFLLLTCRTTIRRFSWIIWTPSVLTFTLALVLFERRSFCLIVSYFSRNNLGALNRSTKVMVNYVQKFYRNINIYTKRPVTVFFFFEPHGCRTYSKQTHYRHGGVGGYYFASKANR